MNIKKSLSGTELTIMLEGRLDTMTAPELEKELKENYDSITGLVLDFKDLEYISSAGLRVLLSAHKALNGKLVVKNVIDTVMEVFEITGFADILTIE
ncbi:MAG: STAS domain-containing protein [Clostridia bacterium]|nr:STAS domain-containing protein [Clostridia bacterium]